MRVDQIERLEGLSERLMDILIDEVDPDNWAGADKPIAELSREERGDRFWCKRNAAATLSIITRSENLIQTIRGRNKQSGQAEASDDLEEEIREAEKESERLIKRIQSKAKKEDFLKKMNAKK